MSDKEAQISLVLDAILATGISKPQPDDAVTLDILLSNVLPAYANQQTTNDRFVLKIFKAIQIIAVRSKSALVESLNYQSILVNVVQFFNSTIYSNEIIESAYSAIIQMISEVFSGKIRNEKYQSDITEYLASYLDEHLNALISEINSVSTVVMYDELQRHNSDLVSQLSICAHVLQIVLNFSSTGLNGLDLQHSLTLESFIRKQWFLLDNFVSFIGNEERFSGILSSLYGLMFKSLYYYTFASDYLRTERLSQLSSNIQHFLNKPMVSYTDGNIAASLAEVILLTMLRCSELECLPVFLSSVQVKPFHFIKANDSTQELDLARILAMMEAVRLKLQGRSDDTPDFVKPFLKSRLDNTHLETLQSDVMEAIYPQSMETKTFVGFHSYEERQSQFKGRFSSVLEPSFTALDVSSFVKDTLEGREFFLEQSTQARVDIISLINCLGKCLCCLTGDMDRSTMICCKCDVVVNDSMYLPDVIDTSRVPPDAVILISQFLEKVIFSNSEIVLDHLICTAMLITMRRLFISYPIFANTDTYRRFWDFLKTCFRSKSREVRLSSAKLYPFFLLHPSIQVRDYNVDIIMTELNSIGPGKATDYLFEAVIVAWGELTIVTPVSDKLFVMLNPLIHFIGSANQFHSSKAIQVLEVAASSKKLTPWQLIEPFIPYVSLTVVQKLKSRPSFLTSFCDLIRLDPRNFLRRTIQYTAPYLIRSYKDDIIGDIAKRTGESRHSIIQATFPKILALLIFTEDEINETKIMKILGNASPAYKGLKWKIFMDRLDILPVFYEVLVFSGPEAEDKVIRKLKWLMHTKASIRGSNDLDEFLGSHILRIIQTISEWINNVRGKAPYISQVQNLRGLNTLIRMAGNSLVSCLPQILSCLQVGAEQPGLVSNVLRCIYSLVEMLTEDPLVIIGDTILSFILQKYSSFDTECQARAKEIVDLLFSETKLSFKKATFCGQIFSIVGCEGLLSSLENSSQMMQQHRGFAAYTLLVELERKSHSDNKWVMLQTLEDLERFFERFQKEHQNICLNQRSYGKVIRLLVDSLMNASYKFKDSVPEIPKKCAVMLSAIGSLDNSRLGTDKLKGSEDVMIPITCFEDGLEASKFVTHFINNVLVPAYWASEESTKQLLLAYTMQEYLKFLGLFNKDVEVLSKPSSDTPSHGLLWSRFNRTSQTTLVPLLHSKYKVFPVPAATVEFPVFKDDKPYADWIKTFTMELLNRIIRGKLGTRFRNATAITACASHAIKGQDIVIPQYLLPYFCLILVTASEDSAQIIKSEFMEILDAELSEDAHSSIADGLRSCYESVFSVLDFFRIWLSSRKQKKISTKDKNVTLHNDAFQVEEFLRSMSFFMLAKKSSQSNSYERSALYLDQFYRTENKLGKEQDYFESIQKVYSEIGDLDALDGILKTFSTQSLSEKLLQFEYSKDFSVKLEGLETLASSRTYDSAERWSTRTRLFKALYDHNHHGQLLEKLNSGVAHQELSLVPDRCRKEWATLGLQASVFLGDLANMKRWVFETEQVFLPPSLSGFALYVYDEVAKGLISLSSSEFEETLKHIDNARDHLGVSLRSTKNSSPLRNKEILNLLHMLYDFHCLTSAISNQNQQSLTSAVDLVKSRLRNTSMEFESSFKMQSLQTSVLSLGQTSQSGPMWLENSKLARKSGKLDIATNAVMKAMMEDTLNVDVEHAKLLWSQGEQRQAISLMRTYLESDESPSPKAQLKLAKWLDQSANVSSTEIIREYLLACSLDKESGKAHYHLGRYYNKILDSQIEGDPRVKKSEKDFYGEGELNVVKQYMRAIQFSPRYLFETLPKVVTLWLDFSESYRDLSEIQNFSKENILSRRETSYNGITKILTNSLMAMPKYYWYSVLSQLISRILHPDATTASLIQKIVVTLCQNYPETSLWSAFSQYKSTSEARQAKGTEIFDAVKNLPCIVSSDLDNGRIVHSALQFLESLLGICRVDLGKRKTSADLKDDLNFQHSGSCLALFIPLRSNFQLALSNTQAVQKKGFPSETRIRFQAIDRHVQILSSMQRPRRLFVKGSNGGRYSILCKPHDDLRKDARLMEFTTVVDRLLKRDPESERRNLQISSYAVVPLNEQMGIIEWVDGCRTLRNIWLSYLSSAGNPCDIGYCKKALADEKSTEEKIKNFERLLDKYPPIFHLWFLDQFPDPSTWYANRNNYVRSSAVMSIVGYLVGMGDRHGDNILISESTGRIMHVDFDCLFDKGLSLAIPERVPFRLTQNMVDACGVTGYEGAFRKACEATNNLVRTNESTLMNVLESFLYDPIIDWMPKKQKSATKRKVQKNDRYYSQAALSAIRRKIRGVLDVEGMPVSVEGQVDAIILQATNVENLAQMYIGWMPFL
ncbi:unnamed protein product [Kuraishia capsulata CBS 1993]|uniref:non-specific serine/threonine protein kinase n=1 Tax=Kuraishia capsulata CBS 1993 TaxID=1382522 RepID=W6MPA3_9ASCO|nr:uncharacterized protein KUCA_T00002909001 [Kuraishia capsulata CBS 1993]CDK26932.1 unnamed protein product [Kuraishia capsulata CBS 1993]